MLKRDNKKAGREKYMARFTNQAQLRYGRSIANSNIAVGEILEVLSAAKKAVRNTYRQNDTITYVISIVNAGTLAYTGLTITDNLGAYPYNTTSLVPLDYMEGTAKYYINGVLQPAPAVTAGPPLVINGITVPAGGNAVIVYEAEVNPYAPLAATGNIVNTATITGGGITPIEVTETVVTDNEPLLNITKSISPVPVTENGTLTYTFLIQNTGNTAADAATAAEIIDTFDPILSNIAVSYNGTALAAGTDYTYNEATGLFATTAGRITVPAAAYTQDPATGSWIVTPGTGTLTVTGTI